MGHGRYETIQAPAGDSFIERKSEFMGWIAPARTEDEALGFLEKIRSEHRRATHNVYAYLLREGNTARYSDDGEPQGTAGVPVLDVLKKEGLTDVCCVVTRYFGGILLGGGGLVRAYSHAAKLAVDAASRKIMCPCHRVQMVVDYSYYGKAAYFLPDYEVKMLDTVFEEMVTLIFLVRTEQLSPLLKKLTDSSNGTVIPSVSEEMWEDFA